jgi:hypothetical protein
MVATLYGREPEAEERPLLKVAIKQRDLGYYFVCDSDLWSVVTSCKSAYQSKPRLSLLERVTVSLYISRDSQKKAVISSLKTINYLVFVMDVKCMFCDV